FCVSRIKKFMKKIYSIGKKFSLLLASVIFATSASCNNSGKNENAVELWTMQLKPTFNDYMTNLLDSYKKQNPKAEIEWVDLPSTEIEQKTLTSIAGGKSPDVINLNPNFTAKLAEEGALSDLEAKVTPEIKNSYF